MGLSTISPAAEAVAISAGRTMPFRTEMAARTTLDDVAIATGAPLTLVLS